MHFEILVEDHSGKCFLDIVVPRLIGENHSYRIIPYRGIGHLPRDLARASNPMHRQLLSKLPQLLQGYGKAFANVEACVLVVCDLDSRRLDDLLADLKEVLDACTLQPTTRFCIAIEEGEAWLLGDIAALKAAYPKAKDAILNTYTNDSICGTWELMADAVYSGGAKALAKQGWQVIGTEKAAWAKAIAPVMDFDSNRSPSFCHFRDTVRELALP